MTTPNRRNGRASLPHTPITTTPPSHGRVDSFAEPRSELLRHALDAKRAAHATPTPTPIEPRQAQSSEILRKATSDPWLDNAKNEEDTTKTTPVRRSRRPSEGALPRMRTQRELHAENDSLKNAQMDLKIRLEALKDQHNKLLDQWEEDRKRIKELEPYEDEVFDLRDANIKLASKTQDMEDEIMELREQNQEILKISGETVGEMERKEEALQEAAEIILGLEQDKANLVEEIEQLKSTQLSKSQTATDHNTDAYVTANEHTDYPTRVHSIDESRPSTGYHDSDYYSMPASPHDKRSQESMVVVSERAKRFINMKKETQRSIKDLSRRLSNASLKSNKKKQEPVPKVPEIPEAYQKQAPATVNMRTPRRIKSVRTSLSPALAYDPYASVSNSAPHTPTGGLRTYFQNSLSLDTSSQYRPASHRSNTTNSTLGSKSKQSLRGSDAPVAPARQSSRAAPTSYSAERLRAEPEPEPEPEPVPVPKFESFPEPDVQSEAGTEETWEIAPSMVSESVTTELDANFRGPWYNQISSWGTNVPGKGSGGAQRATSYTERNFLFNPTEDEDQFAEKTRSLGRRPR